MVNFKTLHLTNAWHATSGGISTFYRALLDGAERRKHWMRLVVPAERDGIEEVGEFGRIYHVAAPAAPLNAAYRIMYPRAFLAKSSPIARILQEERPDLVEISDKYSLQYLGGLLREGWVRGYPCRPTVVGLSCERMDENFAAYLHGGKAAAHFSRLYMKWLYFPMFDHHITVSPHTAGELAVASRGHKVSRGVWIGPMGVDCARFSPARRRAAKRLELAAAAGGDENSTLLLYTGRLVREKNLGLLLDAMERLNRPGARDYRLLIAGSGDMRARLQSKAAAQSPGKVHFLDHIADRDTLADLYANADIFVHPNPREPFGIAPLEAMASGLPLVAPNSGGITVYANERNAWLASPDAEAFASAIREVHEDRAALRSKVSAALESAARHGWDSIADHYLRLYRDLHSFTRGLKPRPSTEPLFFSTPGTYFGREIAPRPARVRSMA